MRDAAADLSSQNVFTAAWASASLEEDLARWATFLTEQGVAWSLDAKDRELVDRLLRSGSARAGETIELRLSKLANDALAAAGDKRRVFKQVAPGTTRRWYLLSPEQHAALEQSGQRFESGMSGPLRQLATIPVTLGVYFLAQYVCREAGVDENVAWVLALMAYVLTARVVRGRWPLQPG